MNYLKTWNELARPPQSALKQIGGGRLRGMTDINPQWRFKAMTETFGPVGFGWTYTILKQWIEEGTKGQKVAFTNVALKYVRDGQWSVPVEGTGGSMFIEDEKAGLHTSDEAFKMSLTDALSVAMKAIGVGADIYLGQYDGSKYRAVAEEKPAKKPTPAPEQPVPDYNKTLDAIAACKTRNELKALWDSLKLAGVSEQYRAEAAAKSKDLQP